MTPRSIPNAITIARMVMALPLLWLLVTDQPRAALWLAVLAGLSDALDGFIAKRFGWTSVLGGVLDPLADKLLLSVCFFGLWWSKHLPTWLVSVVLVRDLVILAGAFAWWKLSGSLKPEPSGISKATTLTQLVLITLMLGYLAGFAVPYDWFPPLVLATAGVTLISGTDYVVRYGRRAWKLRGSGR